MKTLRAAAVAAVTLTATLAAGPAAAENFAGTWTVQGTNFDGSRYGGTARITITSDTTCEIIWNTGSVAKGICMRNGPAFAAAYVMNGKAGLVVYRIVDDRRLEGFWTIAGESGSGTEILVKK